MKPGSKPGFDARRLTLIKMDAAVKAKVEKLFGGIV